MRAHLGITLAFVVACGSEPIRIDAPRLEARASATPATTDAAVSAARASASPAASGAPTDAPPRDLPPSDAKVTRVFDQAVTFLITGEDGRLAVLAVEDGKIVPHRYEAGRWARMELPEAHRATAEDELGIYFGRDNRPRLMGYRPGPKKMVYLRYRDGKWQDQPSEIGALASDDAHLFGVLGEADPEVVCRVDKLCLIKSRKGWQEVKPDVPVDAVIRAFHGRGYALTAKALVVAGAKGFEPMGPPPPWKTRPTGFWVSAEGECVVVEPERGLIHLLDAGGAAWRSEAAPIAGPRDVVGSAARRTIVGDGGIARGSAGKYARVGERGQRFHRVIERGDHVVAGGASGVVDVF